MRRKILIGIAALWSLSAHAATPWPEGAKSTYVERCSQSMSSQGMPSAKARAFCSCAANGMSTEFGMEGQEQLMKAQPNPKGSASDQRLDKILSACK